MSQKVINEIAAIVFPKLFKEGISYDALVKEVSILKKDSQAYQTMRAGATNQLTEKQEINALNNCSEKNKPQATESISPIYCLLNGDSVSSPITPLNQALHLQSPATQGF